MINTQFTVVTGEATSAQVEVFLEEVGVIAHTMGLELKGALHRNVNTVRIRELEGTVAYKEECTVDDITRILTVDCLLLKEHIEIKESMESTLHMWYYKGYHIATHEEDIGSIFKWAFNLDQLEELVIHYNEIKAM